MTASRKKLIRTQLLKQRRDRPSDEYLWLCQQWTQRAFSFLSKVQYQCIAGYMPIQQEINPLALLDQIRANENATCLPAIVPQPYPAMSFYQYYGRRDELEMGPHDIPQPRNQKIALHPDIILIPLVGFDLQGNRLGYGGGYYDRALPEFADSSQLIGCAFDEQECAPLPAEPHDIPLHRIITPSRVIEFR